MQHHAVQLFDSDQSLAAAVSTFIRDGLVNAQAVLVIATRAHADDVRRRCREQGIDAETARADGRLTICDAEEVLAKFIYRDRADWERFDNAVGTLVRRLRADSQNGLRIYGEAVDVLVRRGHFDAAQSLEAFWNRLADREPFQLFCGYSSEHFGNPRDAAALRRICELHTHVSAGADDVLGSFLLKTHAAC